MLHCTKFVSRFFSSTARTAFRLYIPPSSFFISRKMTSPADLVEQAKKAAAYKAVDTHFPKDPKVIGIGSGSTVVYVVDRIAELAKKDPSISSKVVFVPTSFQSKQLLQDANLIIGSVDNYYTGQIEVAFDGADEVDTSLNCIKGGGACQLQEKIVSLCAKKFVLVADYRKKSSKLGEAWTQGIPVEVVGMAFRKVTADLYTLGAKKVTLRLSGKSKAGPVVTDNGNFVLDADFGPLEPENVHKLDKDIKSIVGVIETGLFTNADVAFFGEADGTYSVREKPVKSSS